MAVGSSSDSDRDAYALPGDAIAYNNMCPRSVGLIWGINSNKHCRLETVLVSVTGKIVAANNVKGDALLDKFQDSVDRINDVVSSAVDLSELKQSIADETVLMQEQIDRFDFE